MGDRSASDVGSPIDRWSLAIAATLTMTVSYFDRQALGALGPAVKEALHVSNVRYGWLVSAFSIAYLVGSPLAGRMIDRIGARRGLLSAVLVWSGVAALHALVPTFGVLFALRIALGLAEAPSFPGAAQTVQRSVTPKSRPRAFGLLFTGSSFGALTAPVAAGFVTGVFGWRAAFLVTALVGLAWVPLWLFVTRGREARELLGPRPSESRGAKPDIVFEMLLHPAVLRGAVIIATSAPAVSFVFNWGSSYLHDVYGIEQKNVGHYLWLPPILFDAGSLAFGYLGSRVRTGPGSPRLLVGLAAIIGAVLGLTVLTHTPWTSVIVMGTALVGVGGLFALLTADMLRRVPPAAVSTASGIAAAVQALAYIASNPWVGQLKDTTGSYARQLVVLGAMVVPGVLVWILWPPPPPVAAPAPREG